MGWVDRRLLVVLFRQRGEAGASRRRSHAGAWERSKQEQKKKEEFIFLDKKPSSFVENYNLSLMNSMFSVIKSFNNLDDADNITMLPLALNFVIF